MGMNPRDLARENLLTDRPTAARGFLGELPAFIKTEHLVRPRGFSLRLEDGSRWWIGGSRHAAFMAEKLGNIMALEEGDPEDSRLIYFYDKDADRIELDIPRLQAQGWIKIYQDFVHILFHPRWHHVICEHDARREDSFYSADVFWDPRRPLGEPVPGGTALPRHLAGVPGAGHHSGRTGRDRKVHLQPPRAPSLAGLL